MELPMFHTLNSTVMSQLVHNSYKSQLAQGQLQGQLQGLLQNPMHGVVTH